MANPTPKKITSLQNPLVKHLVKLREERAYREMEGQALVFGSVVIEELSKKLETLALFSLEGGKDYIVTREVLKKISGLKSAPDSAAIFPLPKEKDCTGMNFILVCDRISDPGNLGTLVRSAIGLGWEGLFLLDHSVDLFNDKVIRASRGASFLLPYCRGNLKEFDTFAKKNHLTVFVADVTGHDVREISGPKKAALLLGTEGQGQSKEALKLGKKITIPMKEGTDSLNVAVAGSILMYALKES